MIGVVADDITGAGDIGIMFAKSWMEAHVYSYTEFEHKLHHLPLADVVILDTNSRFDDEKTAYDKVYNATLRLKKEGAERFINKTCSVFRGNIGTEFDAMLDALHEEFAVVVLGFPRNGRTTINGIHYVHGKKLEDSEFRNDPVHPMRCSDLQGILQNQTKRKVATIHVGTVQLGPEALAMEIDRLRSEAHYVIIDVLDQSSLKTIAKAVENERIICGSSALAEEIAGMQTSKGQQQSTVLPLPPLKKDIGILITSGSLMPQTDAQIKVMKEKGIHVIELNTLELIFSQQHMHALTKRYVDRTTALLRGGTHVLLHTTNDTAGVERTKEEGKKQGISNKEVSRIISSALADITAQVLELTGQNRVVIAGGDTSAAFCERLGIRGMRIHKEIQAGLPSCLTFTNPELLVVLKSGSFGPPDFFEQAICHLLEQ